jgi:arylsulfatase B
MATEAHTPKGRGYDTSLFYFHHDNDYWTERVRASDAQQLCPGQDHQLVDLWNDAQPGLGLNNTADICGLPPHKNGSTPLPYPVTADGKPNLACTYEDDLFLHRVLSTIQTHDPATPLFFFWAAHTIHAPLQVPKLWYDRFEHVDDAPRRKYLAMVNWLDTAVNNVTDLLKSKQMYLLREK